MHRIDASDFATNGGKRQAGLGPPATVVGHESFNAHQEEIANFIEDVGMTLEATSSADRTAGFVQLIEAVRRGAWKVGTPRISAQTLNANPYTLTMSDSLMVYILSEASPLLDRVVIMPEPIGYNTRFVLVVNATSNNKKVGPVDNPVNMPATTVQLFYFNNAFVPGFKWVPLGMPQNTTFVPEGTNLYWTQARFDAALAVAIAAGTAQGAYIDTTFSMEARRSDNASLLATVTARYIKEGKKVTLRIPEITVSLGTTSAAIALSASGDAVLPAAIQTAEVELWHPSMLTVPGISGASEWGKAAYFNAIHKIWVSRTGNLSFQVGTNKIMTTYFSYFLP